MDTLPLYMFYHPETALASAAGALPAIEGVNIRLARDIVGTVTGGCARKEKKVSHWRAGFMTLSDLLCWPILPLPAPPPPPAAAPGTEFLRATGLDSITYPGFAFHPALVAERINAIRGETARATDPDILVRPSEGLPAEIRRAIAGKVTAKDRAALERPRVVLSTPLTRKDPRFEQARAAISRRRGRPAGN